MSERKMVSRSVAVALGIICIILAVGLVGTIADYTSIITSKNNTITTRDSQIASLDSQIANKNSQISSLNSQVTNLQSQLNDLNSTVNLDKHEYWEGGESRQQSANSYDSWAGPASYAGYVEVDVASNMTSTYVRVMYYSHGVNYDNQIVVGAGNTRTYFPILPAFEIRIRVGNTELSNGATIAVTIIYYY